jgi:hypothetical protein
MTATPGLPGGQPLFFYKTYFLPIFILDCNVNLNYPTTSNKIKYGGNNMQKGPTVIASDGQH